ncbi:MAG TPA: hypothetical protein VHO84_15435 [Syntrophorhabdaceae bacterium]|nr:hypothetical protein [Syntrophorhabdaceae bacterium]
MPGCFSANTLVSLQLLGLASPLHGHKPDGATSSRPLCGLLMYGGNARTEGLLEGKP